MVGSKVFLLVDDDDDDREIFEDVLQEVDATTSLHTATNGREALELLSGSHSRLPHLIFLDVNMPLMNGKDCLRQLKKAEGLKEIPVVMYTTSTLATDISESLRAGAAGYIPKPTSVEALKQILSAIVQSSPASLEEVLKKWGRSTRFE